MLIAIATRNLILRADYAPMAEGAHGVRRHDAPVNACRASGR